MFWHFLKVVYSRACESRGVWIKVRKLKDIYMFPMINFLKNLQRKGGFFYEQIQAFRCFYFKFRSCTST